MSLRASISPLKDFSHALNMANMVSRKSLNYFLSYLAYLGRSNIGWKTTRRWSFASENDDVSDTLH